MTDDTFAPDLPGSELRTAWGSPKRWTRPGLFAVLLSSTDEVRPRKYDPGADTWTTMVTGTEASEEGAMVSRAQPGLEFEVMRLEAGVWRDFLGRTARQVIEARWPR